MRVHGADVIGVPYPDGFARAADGECLVRKHLVQGYAIDDRTPAPARPALCGAEGAEAWATSTAAEAPGANGSTANTLGPGANATNRPVRQRSVTNTPRTEGDSHWSV